VRAKKPLRACACGCGLPVESRTATYRKECRSFRLSKLATERRAFESEEQREQREFAMRQEVTVRCAEHPDFVVVTLAGRAAAVYAAHREAEHAAVAA
jgi:hypothetical protein